MSCRVSVVIPAYNVERYVGNALQSVLEQTEADFEIIVVDDGSTDATISVVTAFGDQRIKLLLNERNLGASQTRNRAIEKARGEWVAFLDSDDWWARERLARLLAIGSEEAADMVADDCSLIEDGAAYPWATLFSIKRLRLRQPRRISPSDFVRLDLGLTKPMIRRRFLTQHGIKFDAARHFVHDFQYYLSCLVRGAAFVVIPESYYFSRSRSGALTASKVEALHELCEVVRDALLDERIREDATLTSALSERLRGADEEIAYYSVVRLLKRLALLDAARELVRHPRMVLFGLGRLPNVVRARMSRRARAGGIFRGPRDGEVPADMGKPGAPH